MKEKTNSLIATLHEEDTLTTIGIPTCGGRKSNTCNTPWLNYNFILKFLSVV